MKKRLIISVIAVFILAISAIPCFAASSNTSITPICGSVASQFVIPRQDMACSQLVPWVTPWNGYKFVGVLVETDDPDYQGTLLPKSWLYDGEGHTVDDTIPFSDFESRYYYDFYFLCSVKGSLASDVFTLPVSLNGGYYASPVNYYQRLFIDSWSAGGVGDVSFIQGNFSINSMLPRHQILNELVPTNPGTEFAGWECTNSYGSSYLIDDSYIFTGDEVSIKATWRVPVPPFSTDTDLDEDTVHTLTLLLDSVWDNFFGTFHDLTTSLTVGGVSLLSILTVLIVIALVYFLVKLLRG